MRVHPAFLRHLCLSAVLLGLLAVTACGGGGDGDTPDDDGRTSNISQQEVKLRQERIREFFALRRKARGVVATTKTDSGQLIDWIDPRGQTVNGVLALRPTKSLAQQASPDIQKPEKLSRPPLQNVEFERSRLAELQAQRHARGPQGTVPVAVFDVEAYLKLVRIPPENPAHVLVKPPAPAPDTNDRYYAFWRRTGTYFGGSARINIWDTAGPVGNETSIAQIAVSGGSVKQTVEAGKIENQSLNGDRGAYFFTWFTTNGYAERGDNLGGYNTLQDGWVQVSSTVFPGMSLAPWASIENGNQYSLDVMVFLWEGNWWIRVANEWAGYYPGSLFDEDGIAESAERVTWYGEVFDASAPNPTNTDMGSGDFAGDGWEHAAYFRNVTYIWSPEYFWWFDSGSITTTDAGCYSASGPFYSNDPNWRNWFYFGGPGAEAGGCN